MKFSVILACSMMSICTPAQAGDTSNSQPKTVYVDGMPIPGLISQSGIDYENAVLNILIERGIIIVRN